jgi:hypothetical protein
MHFMYLSSSPASFEGPESRRYVVIAVVVLVVAAVIVGLFMWPKHLLSGSAKAALQPTASAIAVATGQRI